jgi:phosphomannomutase
MLEGDARVIVRPSGTEPKLKLYIDATGDTREQAEAVLREIETDLKELIEGLS